MSDMIDMSGVNETGGGFEVLPKGKYKVSIADCEIKHTRDRSGMYISAELEVMDGDHKGRKLWHNFNIKNQSSKATEIGLGTLKRVLRIGGKDPEKLNLAKLNETMCGIVFDAFVVVKDNPDFGPQNNISSFDEPSGSTSPKAASSGPTPFD